MTLTIEAVYQNGVLKPTKPLALPEGSEVKLTMTMTTKEDDPFADLIGVFSSGRTDGAANHDKYLKRKRRR
jgi:predicted DNA-binding antitoxin AbrB/MazE fold protein